MDFKFPSRIRALLTRSSSIRLALLLAVPSSIVIVTWMTITLPDLAADRLTSQQAVRHAQLLQRKVLGLIENGGMVFNGAELTQDDQRALIGFGRTSEAFRMKLFDHEGRIIWSTRNAEINTSSDNPALFDVIKTGQVLSVLATKPPTEIENLLLHALPSSMAEPERTVSEVYTPVSVDGAIAGAIEFYTDVTDDHVALTRLMRLLVGGIGGAAALFSTIVLLFLIRLNAARLRNMRMHAEQNSDLMAQQVQLAREVQLLGELGEWLQSAATLDELFEMVAQYMWHILPTCEGAIYVYSNSRDVLDGGVSWSGAPLHDHIRPDHCWGLRRGRPFAYGEGEVVFACKHVEHDDGRPYFCFPILAHGETVGLMHLRALASESPEMFRDSRKQGQRCAEQISMAIANVRMRDQLHERSIKDPLTGLYNRRHMLDRLRLLTERARLSGGSVTLLSIDVDHFKKFNDNHGHDAGDMVLRAVAATFAQSTDGEAIACRPGGEEFAIVLPEVSGDAAVERAEALRAAVEQIEIRYGDRTLPRITISIGVAEFPRHAAMVQDLILASDQALYAAKAQGRNRVVILDAGRSNGAAHRDDDTMVEAREDAEQETDSGAAGETDSGFNAGMVARLCDHNTAARQVD